MTPGYARYAPTAGPSRWLVIAGRTFLAAVESTVSDAIVDTLFWLAGSELAMIESVVGAFPLAGPESVRSFAVAELGPIGPEGETVVTAVVRGSAAIDVFSVGGARRFGSGGVQPWVLAEFRGVTGLVLGGEDAPTGPVARRATGSLPIGIAVVDGELLTWSASPLERAAAAEARPEAPEAPSDPAAVDETIIRGRQPGSSLFLHPEAPVIPGGHPVSHEVPGAIDIEEPPAAGPVVRTPGISDRPGPVPLVGAPAIADPLPETEPVIRPKAPASFAVRLPSGESIPLDEPVVLGRRPVAPRVGSGPVPRLVAVASATQEVSSTHARIEQSGDAVVVTDLRSTNGTRVTGPGGSVRLRPGESRVVLIGARVDIGDGNIIEITARRDEGRE
ncbi:FHA domain-containing protein [Leifsonia sp. AG29]|uniref:FHA domain-containing protein n=1 Tax=Leifsonia sp. AG29 TaxID=2598860 RepID=UPI00131D1B4C|nr:FHA domain-containing protein [Leifsonia sp. AG29]